ncbi:MAG: hypothetical protein NZ585_02480 [Chloracidobacterium sp.]|nr:hypothetical protein [Chloracidobacterium sp.]MDW8218735.1 hypothetical protein [Acidobacteriota bacterium]
MEHMRMIASRAEDAWHALRQPGAYEWWYFDALSEDHEYGLVAIWFCGMPFSADYNAHLEAYERGCAAPPNPCDYAAFSFALYHRGRPIAYALVEYDDFTASTTQPAVWTGRNAFTYDPATATYHLVVDVELTEVTTVIPVAIGRRLTGTFTFRNLNENWFAPALAASGVGAPGMAHGTHTWNLVAPVCTTHGALEITDANGRCERRVTFTGRGYHDHNYDTVPMLRAINRWHWGRCWRGDRMLIYYRNEPFPGQPGAFSFGAVFDGAQPQLVTDAIEVVFEAQRRNWLGLKYPHHLRITLPATGETWTIRQQYMVDSGPFYVRFLSGPGTESNGNTYGVSETLDGVRLRRRIFRPMINTRIQRPASRGALLPAPVVRLGRTALIWLVT